MNRSEFCSLPPSVALGLIWDQCNLDASLGYVEAPKPARPPKFDQILYRKEGIMWASECDAEGLRWWHKRAAESAESGSQYAEKDAKLAKSLGFWIAYREQNPTAIWSGERNREQVTAKAPQSKPEVYPRDGQRAAPAAPSSSGGYSDADYGSDDDLPF
jgi:hypothetical protein